MVSVEVLNQLVRLAGQLGIELRWEDGEFSGGLCRLGDRFIFVLNPTLALPRKVEILCRGLSRFDLSEYFLVPAVRELLEGFCETGVRPDGNQLEESSTGSTQPSFQ